MNTNYQPLMRLDNIDDMRYRATWQASGAICEAHRQNCDAVNLFPTWVLYLGPSQCFDEDRVCQKPLFYCAAKMLGWIMMGSRRGRGYLRRTTRIDETCNCDRVLLLV